MSYTNGLDKPSDFFNTVLYTGNGSSNAITGIGFAPDWLWIKSRGLARSNQLVDKVRGSTKMLASDNNSAEFTAADRVASLDSDGFTLGSNDNVNGSSDTLVSWNWKAGGSASSNSDGSITSTVSVNQTAGFSILTRNGTGSNGTVGHGLGVAPKMIINKDRDSGSSWWGVFHESLGNTHAIYLNTTNAADSSVQYWNNTSPTSSVFSVGTNSISNASGGSYISYCFAEKKGYSKFGSYTGNGSSSGTYVHLGFKPAFVICKRTDNADNWMMVDNKRGSINLIDEVIFSDLSQAEVSTNACDFLSNGFKARTTSTWINASGGSYIFMAFAESPFVTSTGIPTTAR